MALDEAELLSALNIGVSKEPITDAILIAINSVNEDAIKLARQLILDQSKSKSATLAQSIIALPIIQNGPVYTFVIEGDEALDFIDKGVNGTEGNFASPYSFKHIHPSIEMAEAVRNWIPSANIFKPAEIPTYESFSWAIATNVKKRGIAPKSFIEESFGVKFRETLELALSVALEKAVVVKLENRLIEIKNNVK